MAQKEEKTREAACFKSSSRHDEVAERENDDKDEETEGVEKMVASRAGVRWER